MGYVAGLVKYIVKSAFRNTGPMVIFGGATLALILLFHNLGKGHPVDAVIAYVTTKHLPPFTVKAFLTVLIVGCVWAGVKWFARTPRR